MTTYFVSRHPGAREWARDHDIAVDEQIDHLDVHQVKHGDVIIGTLPIHLAAEVCEKGARYLHLSLQVPLALRGLELEAEMLVRLGAELEEFVVLRPTEACH